MSSKVAPILGDHSPLPELRKRNRSSLAIVGNKVSGLMMSDRSKLIIAELKAAVSILDMASDIIMCVRYREQGEVFFFRCALVCILLHLSCTSLTVFISQRVSTGKRGQ